MKKWIIRIAIALLAIFLLIGLIPFSKEIHYSGTAYEFSLAYDGAVAEHEIKHRAENGHLLEPVF